MSLISIKILLESSGQYSHHNLGGNYKHCPQSITMHGRALILVGDREVLKVSGHFSPKAKHYDMFIHNA